jgi:hypothetical protein
MDHVWVNWWNEQIMAIEELLYEGTNFRQYLKLALPPGEQWGPLSKNARLVKVF